MNNSAIAFRPVPTIGERKSIDALPDEIKQAVLKMGEDALTAGFPELTVDDWLDFSKTGCRARFEGKYFERRHMLNSLAAAEYVENRGRFLPKIEYCVREICREPGWQLPAHNSYIRNAPVLPLPDPERPVLDLFACETGAQLAMLGYMLGPDRLKDTFRLIYDEVSRRIVKPYLGTHFWWMGNGDEPMCNWTPWCTQNVLVAALLTASAQSISPADTRDGAVLADDEVLLTIFERSLASLDCFLKDYGEDGCCNEGPHYYRHAGLCLDRCLAVMREALTASGKPMGKRAGTITDEIDKLYSSNKVRNMAMYIYHMHACGKYYFNFADSAAVIGRCGVREFLFGENTQSPLLMRFAASDVVSFKQNTADIFSDESTALNLYVRMLTVFEYGRICNAASASEYPSAVQTAICGDACEAEECPTGDIYYESVGIFITRSRRFRVAVKLGCNDDSHNHNDTGSFIVYRDGEPLFADIGVETYSAKTFSSERYDIWTMQSCYHNLPTIQGLDQKAGPEFRATDIELHILGDSVSVSFNLATAYPACRNRLGEEVFYRRTVTLDKSSEVLTVSDSTNADDALCSLICPDSAPSGCIFSSPVLHTGQLDTTSDPRLSASWDRNLYRLRLKPGTITVK